MRALPLHLPGNSSFLQLTALPHLVCQLPYTEPQPHLSQPASSLQPAASVLQATLTDQLIKTEEILPQQVERLCTAALRHWQLGHLPWWRGIHTTWRSGRTMRKDKGLIGCNLL